MALFNLIEEKRKEKRKKIVKAATASTIVGGTLGVLSGILLAPKSGKETRNDIKEKANEIKDNTIEKTRELKSNAKEAKNKIKDYLQEKKNKSVDKEVTAIEEVEEVKENEVEE